jgi:FtsP/CotA-like multicopper oxidase with cupredoxin domain
MFSAEPEAQGMSDETNAGFLDLAQAPCGRKREGGHTMSNLLFFGRLLPVLLLGIFSVNANASSFRVQCPQQTPLHPLVNASGATGQPNSTLPNPNIKCQQISGGDGFATMADGTQTYLFSFGPLSGLGDMVKGLPGTQPASIFRQLASDNSYSPAVGDPTPSTTYNGAIGLTPDPESVPANQITGHVDPREIMDVGVLNGNRPAPLMAIDEDDEFFLTLTNVGQIMRPDLFEQHTVHFHGYPNASAFYDGVPDASVAINIGGSFTYYYLAPDAGTYFWHCHITPPEHLQMGMVGQLYVRPRQNRVTSGTLYAALQAQESDQRKRCGNDILCGTPLPPSNSVARVNNKSGTPTLYAYNDGDGSTAYDVEYPIQIMGFDPNFHFVGMTFNPEAFTDNKDKYFLLNGRGYPDTINPGPLHTQTTDGTEHYSQPLPTLINIPVGGRALLRFSDLDTTEMQTLASLGIPMHVIAVNARLLRDLDGNNTDYYTNSITLGGGETIDVILDASDTTKYHAGDTYYLYTPNLDHLSNDAENFGGLMTEVHICNAVDPATKSCS